MLKEETITAGLDPRRSVWISKNGNELPIKPISWMFANRLMTNPNGRPEIPMIAVEYSGGRQGEEANPNDPIYLQKLEDWTENNKYQSMIYCVVAGVALEPPQEFLDLHRQFYPQGTDHEFKYMYVTSLVEPGEFDELFETIMGTKGITEGGLDKAKADFPRPSEL